MEIENAPDGAKYTRVKLVPAFHERLNQMLPGHNEKQLVKEIRKISIPRRK